LPVLVRRVDTRSHGLDVAAQFGDRTAPRQLGLSTLVVRKHALMLGAPAVAHLKERGDGGVVACRGTVVGFCGV
jgi:hypothetical protein